MRQHRAIRAFGKVIREVRRARKLTLEDVAEAAETDAAWLSKVERGEKNVTLLTAVRLAEALSLDLTIGGHNLVAGK